jgi:predicted AAA+ superfamily ATPase
MMDVTKRYLWLIIKEFLANRMFFIGGSRRVGKTTMCLQFLKQPTIESLGYLNWDELKARAKIKNTELPIDEKIICFDEIHKFKNWCSLL